MSRIGTELFPLLFEVKRADTLGQSMYKRAEKLEYIAEYERVYKKSSQTTSVYPKRK